MCQPKSQGGKRCAIHHAGTQAAIQTASIQTNVPTENVKEVFSALNKEGKKLDAPSREEFISYLNKERFVTEIDPTLSEREKRMILKKLNKAETENTPSGGTFHAWKNLLGETVRKYGNTAKKVLATAGIISMLSLTTACSSQGGAVNPNPSSPTSSSASVVSLPAGLTDNGKVTDALGTYEATKLDPNSPLYKLNSSILNNAELSSQGFTTEDAAAAQKWVLDFVSTEGVDSIALDNAAGWDKWKSESAGKYFDASALPGMVTDGSAVIYTASPVQTIRDGKSRITGEDIKVSNIGAFNSKYGNVIEVTGQSVVSYRANEADVVKYISAQKPEYTEEVIKNQFPTLFDGKEETVKATINWIYCVKKAADGSWKLSGFTNKSTTVISGING